MRSAIHVKHLASYVGSFGKVDNRIAMSFGLAIVPIGERVLRRSLEFPLCKGVSTTPGVANFHLPVQLNEQFSLPPIENSRSSFSIRGWRPFLSPLAD